MAAAVLSSLSHPHPETPTIDLKGSKLAGVFLISPWVTFGINSPSMVSNVDKDYLDLEGIKRSAAQFMGKAKEDSYNTPLSASPEWWQDLKVQDICILGAEYEVFVHDIKALANIVKVRFLLSLFLG